MKRIICVGNRYRDDDAAGPLVYEHLARTALPEDVELVDGALAGLDLLPLVEGTERVVFVDAVSGFGTPGGLVVLTADQAGKDAPETYGHSAGLAYLLRILENVSDGPLPEIFLVGIEGAAPLDTTIAAADLCLSIVADGYAAVRPLFGPPPKQTTVTAGVTGAGGCC
jgi:hydrogenase maturation protease